MLIGDTSKIELEFDPGATLDGNVQACVCACLWENRGGPSVEVETISPG